MLQTELSPALQELMAQVGSDIFAPADGPQPLVCEESQRLVARPADKEEVSRVLAAANSLGLKVAPRGSGSKMDRGNPARRIDLVLDLSKLNRIVEHSAGDLVMTAQAGVLLEDLQRELGSAGQFLALDPPFPGSIGGLIATADSGPRRLRYGGVRDQILGVTFVRPDGVLAHGGGKVVKNVAGYDMPKLLTGALGTLGVVVEAVFRLYSRQQVIITATRHVASPVEATRFIELIKNSTLVPTTIDYLIDGAGGTLAVRFEAPERSAWDQAERTRALLGASEVDLLSGDDDLALWSRFDGVASSAVLAWLVAPSADLGVLLQHGRDLAAKAGADFTARAHVGHGHALVGLAGIAEADVAPLLLELRAEAERRDGNLVLWRAPALVRDAVDAWGDPGQGIAVMRRIKVEFDPQNTLNPGRFVGGI